MHDFVLITLTTQLCINIIERCIVFLLLVLFTFPEHQSCHSQRMLGNQWKTNLSHLGVIHIDLSLLLDKHQLPNSLMRPCGHRNAKNSHTIFFIFPLSMHIDCMLPVIFVRGPSQKKCTERNTYRIEHQMCGKVL